MPRTFPKSHWNAPALALIAVIDANAMRRAMEMVRKYELDVKLVSYGSLSPALVELA